jgi:hypothetical protein
MGTLLFLKGWFGLSWDAAVKLSHNDDRTGNDICINDRFLTNN